MSHMPIVMNCSGHIELRTVSDMCHSFQQMYFEIIDLTPLSFTTQLRHHFLLEDSWDLLAGVSLHSSGTMHVCHCAYYTLLPMYILPSSGGTEAS